MSNEEKNRYTGAEAWETDSRGQMIRLKRLKEGETVQGSFHGLYFDPKVTLFNSEEMEPCAFMIDPEGVPFLIPVKGSLVKMLDYPDSTEMRILAGQKVTPKKGFPWIPYTLQTREPEIPFCPEEAPESQFPQLIPARFAADSEFSAMFTKFTGLTLPERYTLKEDSEDMEEEAPAPIRPRKR